MTASVSSGDCPRWLRRLCQAVLAAASVSLLLGAWRTGVAWDETYHVMRMRSYLEHGWYVLPHELTAAGQPGEWASELYVYAPISMIWLHGLGLLAGTDTPGFVSATADAFAVRHLGVAVIGVLGAGASMALAHRIWGWRTGWPWLTGGAVASIGMWTGQAMFNIKDVPVATGFTLWTLGCATWVAAAMPGRARLASAAAVITTLGGVMAVGTRPGIWVGLAAVAVLASLLAWLGEPRARLVLSGLALSAAVAYAVLVVVYPATFSEPLSLLRGSVSESAHFKNETSPWWYVPATFVLETPSSLVLLAATGALVGIWLGIKRRLKLSPSTITWWLCGAQAVVLPVSAMARQSHLYTGTRQLLFVYPALAVLVTAGVAACSHHRVWRPLALAAAAAGIGSAMVGQLLLFPYNYVYQSPVSLLVFGSDATDWWRTSVRELAPAIPRSGRVVCSPKGAQDGDRSVFLPYTDENHGDCASALVGPLAPYATARAATETVPADDQVGTLQFYAITTGRGDQGRETESNCRRLTQVDRFVWWRREPMSVLSLCDMVLADYPPGGINFRSRGSAGPNSGPFELGHFADPHADQPKQLTADSLVGVQLQPKFGSAEPMLLIELADPEQIPEVAINGQPLRPVRGSRAWQVAIPSSAAVDGRLLIRLGPAGVGINRVVIADEGA